MNILSVPKCCWATESSFIFQKRHNSPDFREILQRPFSVAIPILCWKYITSPLNSSQRNGQSVILNIERSMIIRLAYLPSLKPQGIFQIEIQLNLSSFNSIIHSLFDSKWLNHSSFNSIIFPLVNAPPRNDNCLVLIWVLYYKCCMLGYCPFAFVSFRGCAVGPSVRRSVGPSVRRSHTSWIFEKWAKTK